MSETFTPDHPAIRYSPYNWYVSSGYAKCPNPDGSLQVRFTGTSLRMTFDPSAIVSAGYGAGTYPWVKTTIDGVVTIFQLTSASGETILAQDLADTTHLAEVKFIGIDQGGSTDRWTTAVMSLVYTNLKTDTGKTLLGPRADCFGYWLGIGDSIEEGAVLTALQTNPPYYAQVQRADLSWGASLAARKRLYHGKVAFAGESWTGGVSNVPGLATSWQYLWSGVARSFSPEPNLITVNMGTNGSGGTNATVVETFIGNIRGACPRSRIAMIVPPFTTGSQTAVRDGTAAFQSAHPTDTNVILIDRATIHAAIIAANSFDTVHPNGRGHLLIADDLDPYLFAQLRPGKPGGLGAYAG